MCSFLHGIRKLDGKYKQTKKHHENTKIYRRSLGFRARNYGSQLRESIEYAGSDHS